jgi:hypothetical protein
MNTTGLRSACQVLSVLAMLAGAAGMAMSFLYLASSSIADITAGTSGFVAGSVLIGCGLLSLTLLATRGESAKEASGAARTQDAA